ncbi:hypothetical protein ACET8N_06540 [Aeromonas veronii]
MDWKRRSTLPVTFTRYLAPATISQLINIEMAPQLNPLTIGHTLVWQNAVTAHPADYHAATLIASYAALS